MWETMGRERNMNCMYLSQIHTQFFYEICDGKFKMGELSKDVRIILKWIFKQVGTD